MPRRKQPKGQCAYCGQEFAKTEMLVHLRVQDAGLSEFWLDLEMRGSATLKDLDGYLRAIWLECCGHLSRFSHGGRGAMKLA